MLEKRQSPSSASESIGSQGQFIDPHRHSFVVHIWLEETTAEAEQAIWRGYVTHVATGHRRYVTNLSSINDFLASYLTKMGIRLPFLQRLRCRLGLTQNK